MLRALGGGRRKRKRKKKSDVFSGTTASLPPSSKTWLDVREAVRSKATDLGLGPTTFARCAPPRTERIRAYEDFIAKGEVKRPPRQHANPIRKTLSGLQLTRQLYCVFAAALSLSWATRQAWGDELFGKRRQAAEEEGPPIGAAGSPERDRLLPVLLARQKRLPLERVWC